MPLRRPLVAGNWKMNGLRASSPEIGAIRDWAASNAGALEADLLICPPATLIAPFAALLEGSALRLGAQNCHAAKSGAFTGSLSAAMLADAGASAIIVGHSERRSGQGERDADVKAKAAAAMEAGASAIICVGETAGERRMGLTLPVIGRQLRHCLPNGADAGRVVIAYEPVWAIGAGLTPSIADIAQVHAFIRAEISELLGPGAADAMRILYGGSVKPSNAAEIFSAGGVDGGLIGGASLTAQDFCGVASAYLS